MYGTFHYKVEQFEFFTYLLCAVHTLLLKNIYYGEMQRKNKRKNFTYEIFVYVFDNILHFELAKYDICITCSSLGFCSPKWLILWFFMLDQCSGLHKSMYALLTILCVCMWVIQLVFKHHSKFQMDISIIKAATRILKLAKNRRKFSPRAFFTFHSWSTQNWNVCRVKPM